MGLDRFTLSQREAITIVAEGATVCKAVTVAEITKRRLRGLHQNTQIGMTSTANQVLPAPTIAITLSLEPLDPTLPGYQPPLTDDEMLAAWIFDDEMASFDDMRIDAAVVPGAADGDELLPAPPSEPIAAAATGMGIPGASGAGRGAEASKQRVRTRKRKRGNGRNSSGSDSLVGEAADGARGTGSASARAELQAASRARPSRPSGSRPKDGDSGLEIFD